MSEFDYLRAMFRRLSEFEHWRANAKNAAERHAHESAVIAISASIQDYLRMRPAGVGGPEHG